jgi:tetratricopeptide (TPR) repeat protein
LRSIKILVFALSLLAMQAPAEGASGDADELSGDLDFMGCRISANVHNVREKCTRFIDSGRGSDRLRAIALTHRSTALLNASDAIGDLDRAIRLDATYAPAYLARGKWLYEQGESERSLADLSRAIELDPSSGDRHFESVRVKAFYARAKLYDKRGEPERAIGDYGEVLRAFEQAPQVVSSIYLDSYFRRGSIHEKLGRLDQAIADYRRGASLGSARSVPHRDSEEALNRLTRVIK